jgi:hypothetical protein
VKPEERWREIRRQEDEHRLPAPEAAGGGSERNAEEARELEAAGWERRGDGPKAIWRKPEGGHWWVHYQALVELRKERFDARVGHAKPGKDEG